MEMLKALVIGVGVEPGRLGWRWTGSGGTNPVRTRERECIAVTRTDSTGESRPAQFKKQANVIRAMRNGGDPAAGGVVETTSPLSWTERFDQIGAQRVVLG